MSSRKRIALYTRVSPAERSKRESQLGTLQQCCRDSGATVAGRYGDIVEATVPLKDRTELAELLRDAQNGKFDQVLVWSLETIVVDGVKDVFQIQDALRRVGTTLQSYREHFETETAIGQFALQMVASTSQARREREKSLG